MAKAVPLRRDPPERQGEDQPRDATDQRHERQRDRPFRRGDQVHAVHGQKAAEAVIDRVAE
jgi:hypothetical protein